MYIKITNSVGVKEFPYGRLTQTDREFVKENLGKVFPAVRANINYYHLTENGCEVHIYNATEVEGEEE